MLRLTRGEIGGKVYRRENARYREAGRRLSDLRDVAVANQKFDQFAGLLAPADCDAFRSALSASKKLRSLAQESVLAEAAKFIEAARRRVEKWPLKSDDFSALRRGLKETYRSGRKSLAIAYADSTAENFHKWRKQVGCLRDMARILKPVRPVELNELAAQLKTLEAYLSEHHDLDVLRQWFVTTVKKYKGADKAEPFIALIGERQMELQEMARPLGERIYAEKPKAFADRLEEYWQARRQVRLFNLRSTPEECKPHPTI